MNSHTLIKIPLRSPHPHCHPETLQHLPDTQAQQMQAHDLLLRPLAHDLEFRRVLRFLFRAEDVVEHGGELGVVGFDVFGAELGDGLGFGEADCADFGVGEDDGWDWVGGLVDVFWASV